MSQKHEFKKRTYFLVPIESGITWVTVCGFSLQSQVPNFTKVSLYSITGIARPASYSDSVLAKRRAGEEEDVTTMAGLTRTPALQ